MNLAQRTGTAARGVRDQEFGRAMDVSDLLNCPFCGQPPKEANESVRCISGPDCPISGLQFDPADWQTRALVPTPALLEALRLWRQLKVRPADRGWSAFAEAMERLAREVEAR